MLRILCSILPGDALRRIASRSLPGIALAVAGAGDAVGDGAVGEHSGDQQALAGEESHGLSFPLRARDSGMGRRHASYKMVSMVLGTNIVRKELGLTG